MKAEILKIAGVKTEAEFYKKYPTEEAFMKKHGKKLKKAQDGNKFLPSIESTLDDEYLAPPLEYGEISGIIENGYNNKMSLARQLGVMQDFPDVNPNAALKGTSATTATKSSNLKDAGNSLLASAPSIVGGIQNVIKGNKQLKEQKQAANISNLIMQAAGTRDNKKTRKYVRPEDIVIQPGQMGNPYGSGTNYLAAKNGAEIQNTFAPNTIYTDQGYTPLNDNSKVKQFADGGGFGGTGLSANYLAGEAGGLGGGLGSLIGGGDFEQTNEGALGSTLGGIAGTIVGGPLGSIVGSALGGAIGGAFGGDRTKQMKQQKQLMQSNLASAAWQNTLQSDQFNSFMEDGGWVSNDWQPQVIAKFGEYDVKDLLKPPHDADMLRAGGHLKEYTPPSERAMYTGKAEDGVQMAMGGDLKVYRGQAETMSYNPYLPDGGETIMFRGPSHDNGGMPITFGENGVEVEGGEPAVKLQDGGSPDGNLVVFGDMFMPGKKQKFKHYAADLSKTEAKQNKIVDKSTKLINDLDVNTEFDKLTLQAANANILGANMKLKDIATKKTEAATLQNAILDTAKEQGLVSAELAKGKIVKDKEAAKMMAKYGTKMTTYADGGSSDPNDAWINKILDYEYESGSPTGTGLSDWGYHTRAPKTKEEAIKYFKQDYLPKVDYLPQELKGRAADWLFNTGKDPRIPLLLAAGKIKSNAFGPAAERIELAQDPELLNETWNKYADEIGKKAKDPAFLKKFDTARKVMYQNINKLPDGSINPAYGKTWKGRTDIFNEDVPVAASPVAVASMVTPSAPAPYFANPVVNPTGASSAKWTPSGVTVPNFAASNDAVDMRAAFMPEAYAPIDMRNDVKNIPHTPYDGTFVQKRDVPPTYSEDVMSTSSSNTSTKDNKKSNTWKDAAVFASSMMPFLRPSNQEPLDPNQLMGEMYALSNNQLEPVQAQLYNPQLTQPYEISLQDQLNANQSDFNAMQRQLGNNPEALAALAAQKYAANAQVLGTQFRANQAEKARAYEANRQTMNEAQRANLGILDQQFQRQSMARSKTKQEAQTALQSIAAKIAQNNLSNRTLGVYENMYNYRYAPGGQAYNMNAPYSFNIPEVGTGARSTSDIALTEAERLQALADAQKIKEANAKTKKGRNGAIVKAIKNL